MKHSKHHEQRKTREKWLVELTGIPTASGREGRVARWIRGWAGRRSNVRLETDRFGNLHLALDGARSRRPVVLVAHMDHPAFVLRASVGSRRWEAEFRGGVASSYFRGSPIRVHRGGWSFDGSDRVSPGAGAKGRVLGPPEDGVGVVELHDDASAQKAAPGDVATWDVGAARITRGRLVAPAVDNLAGVAAAIAALDAIRRGRAGSRPDLRLLLTRCEEVGFVGAIAACKASLVPRGARVIVLENSKCLPDAPVGDGPIVRVGDRTSTFDPGMTYALAQVASGLEDEDGQSWQRKLMTGGSCEATAFSVFGYRTGCVCLPLLNYHNMDEQRGCIAAESVSVADFHGMVRLLAEAAARIDEAGDSALRSRLNEIYKSRRNLLT